jgi:hypothetical protein
LRFRFARDDVAAEFTALELIAPVAQAHAILPRWPPTPSTHVIKSSVPHLVEQIRELQLAACGGGSPHCEVGCSFRNN